MGHATEFHTADGLTLRGEAWGDATNPPALLLHGGGQTRHAWSGTAQALATEGYYAIALDQRGHGDSDWHPEGHYAFDVYARDVQDVVRQIGRAPVLIGASLGGIASLLACYHGEENVGTGLVLVDIATQMERGGIARIFEFMRGAPDGFATLDEAAEAVAAYQPHRQRPPDTRGLEKNLRRGEDGRWRWHWDPRFIEHRGPHVVDDPTRRTLLDDAARDLRIPTLLVRGRMSDVLSEEGAQAFLDLVPHAQLADITNAGHMVAGDRNDVFTEAVLNFLRGRQRADAG